MEYKKGEMGEKGEKDEKGEKGERGERGKRRGIDKQLGTKEKKGKGTKILKQQQRPARINDTGPKEIDHDTLLSNALAKFPEKCAEKCDPSMCERQDCNAVDGKRELEEFEKLFKTRLKDATPPKDVSGKVKGGTKNLFHIIVEKSWSKTPKQRRFLNWMLQQQEHQVLLGLEDDKGFTPMHNALYGKLDEFVDVVLEVEGLNIINILKKKCPAGNCVHLATKTYFPNLSDMVSKCARDKDILMGDENSPDDTPLHIAVQYVPVPFYDDRDVPGSDDETERPNHDGGQYAQQIHENDLEFSGDDDDDLDGDYNNSREDDESSVSDGESDRYLEGEDEQEQESVRYKIETDQELEARLALILGDLDKRIVRPRPPLRTQDTKPNTLQHPGIEEIKNGELEVGNTSSASQVTPVQDLVELPLNHSVRLLVEACPEALTTKNRSGRTPYQEREHTLLNDPIVKTHVEKYAKKKVSSSDTEEIREARAKRVVIAKDPVSHYIRSFCMRESKSREEIMKRLYKPGQECHIEFDLAGMPTPVIKHEYLDQLEKHLKFESILKYVALPVLAVESQPVRGLRRNRPPPSETKSDLHRNGRSDLVAVFDWLWGMGVREIIRVIVVDDGDLSHADTAIVEALYGFKVEEWDWKRVDLCSDVIYESSPHIREVSLYSSGNNAVLMGWASAEGLGNRDKFPHLEKVNLFVQDGLEDNGTWKWNNKRCREKIIKHGKNGANGTEIDVKIIADNNLVKFSSELSTTENIEEAPAWIKSIRDFSTFLMHASMAEDKGNQVPPVKIAIIDDGIDATMHGLQPKIAGGATFCPYPHSSDLVNSYFVPRGKHGTLMAQLICDICPGTQLYIARLEELPTLTGGGRRVTARSAAKAVDWAVSCGVNIISMSWTIQTAVRENEDMKKLKAAIDRANTANILMFCSASDQGANTTEDCFPGDWNQCIRIGGATFTGEKLTWVDDKVNFWFPGRNVPFISKDGKSVVYESGSSVATAAASGLAGVLLYSARLLYSKKLKDSETLKDKDNPFQDRTAMMNALTVMAKGVDAKFPRTDDILNKMFKKKIQQITKKITKNINTLEWSEASQGALEALLNYIQGS
ncbi:hypothetical protein VE03_01564 [Pseudogymnoascus sp. 23342-1-I1]|nr:hypothetical protein VE03_01564 [Pseudogymnoascus sp. 23342-1-I1]